MKFTMVELPYNFKSINEQGLTNDLFILNDIFFVKRSKNWSKAFLNWENQLNIINLIRNKPFTLPILEAKITEEKLWVLMPYYQNLSTLSNHEINQKTLQQLALLVQQLHEIEVKDIDKIIKWDALKQLNLYYNLISNDNETIVSIKKELESWFNSYHPKNLVLSHNDLIINNFVCYQKEWYLIDWDFATLNDKLFDIASFASETLKKEEDINYWYQLFQLSENDLTIINYWIKYQNFIWYHWAMFLYQKTKDKIYQIIAQEKIKMLLT